MKNLSGSLAFRSIHLRRRTVIFLLVVFLFLLLLALGYLFRHKILVSLAEGLIYEDKLEKCDAAVPLEGSFPDRIIEAGDLFKHGYVDKIIITNEIENTGVEEAKKRNLFVLSENEQVEKLLESMDIPQSSVIRLPDNTDRTVEESTAVAKFISDKPQIKCLALVTSKFHSYRAKKVFSKTFKNKGIKIIVRYPAFDDYDPQNWWNRPRNIRNTINEYGKLLTMQIY